MKGGVVLLGILLAVISNNNFCFGGPIDRCPNHKRKVSVWRRLSSCCLSYLSLWQCQKTVEAIVPGVAGLSGEGPSADPEAAQAAKKVYLITSSRDFHLLLISFLRET